ncbi:VaFE repeat-containing surface-anchored protein [Nocardioides sp. L-11A]|uniref:VaFE repeat-containing surface-anchored protein n=1 Tax=Nocardioides sp. L-11A TaxID=3043848 RepID=UPI00249B079C|nr:VaFE repeat-containing surface-anchored protein [Nocardioides sp. L-11A]
MRTTTQKQRTRRTWPAAVAAVAGALVAGALAVPVPAATAEPGPGDQVYVGPSMQGYSGTAIHGVYAEPPADPGNLGTPDYWAYCIEHDISAGSHITGGLGEAADFLGNNHFTDPAIQGKVLWVLAHSYPALSLADFGAAAGVPGISADDAIEATQYAIWRYTDLTFDAPWVWETQDSQDAYWYLVNGANASGGLTPADLRATAEIAGPAAVQQADSLVGPFTVSTSQPTAQVSVAPALTVTDASGTPVDTAAVVDGQQLYLDLRGTLSAGSATVTVTATGSGANGSIISVPKQPGGTATPGDHAQSMILIAPSTATVTDSAAVAWVAPSIGTSLVDAADGDRVLPAAGGTVIDAVAYQNLTPGTSYTITGELVRKSDGSATGITGSVTFTPTAAQGSIDVHFTVPAGYAGQQLVAFEELAVTGSATVLAEHKDIDDAAQTVSVTADSTPGPAAVSLTTETSKATVKPGAEVFDTVTISGFVPGHGATGSATLYGPFATRDEMACTPQHAVGTVSFAPANGVIRTPSVKVARTGYYTWVAATTADSRNAAATHACGLASETTLVRKPSYRAPVVATGFSSPGADVAGRRKATRLSIPSLGVNARTTMVGIKKGAVQVPGQVARTGQLRKSAAAGDLIGTTVIAGHVSDRHDRPGAFWKLTRVRPGQVVTVREGNRTVRYQVDSVERFSRAKRLPQRFFSTVGEHRLVLISCAGRVTTAGGGFHYRQNVVVTATPLD